MHILDDPAVSRPLRQLLSRADRRDPTPEEVIRAQARAVDTAGRVSRPPAEVVEAMVGFEHRFGGIAYRLIVGNPITYGLNGRPAARAAEQGWAFKGIVDGDLTWGLDVLADGRVAVDFGETVPYRVLCRSVEQRLENDALLAELRHRPHRSFEFRVPNDVVPPITGIGLPPVCTEACGPGLLWWVGDELAFFAELGSWIHEGMDRWNLWAFALRATEVPDAREVPAFGTLQPAESDWCYLCGEPSAAGRPCAPASGELI
ncbi:hypothetical protein AB0B66_25455 [Catellatospora sp. NPDC049111]|uniref:hypothetical protein n=1 Tax=Catellatospora sp. NPDC049111 TaxID=3155271 RepID=UPI0033D33AF8